MSTPHAPAGRADPHRRTLVAMRGWRLVIGLVLIAGGCATEPSSSSLSDEDLAQVEAQASCTTFATVFADAANDGGEFTRAEGERAIARAADGAERAADLESVYNGLATELRGLADGMVDRDRAAMAEHLENTGILCDAVFGAPGN